MDDICRLNVALTRARQSLIICGNFVSLKVSYIIYLFVYLIVNILFSKYRENEFGVIY